MLQSVLIEFLKDFMMSFHHLLQSSHVIFGGKIYQIFGDEPRLKIPSICLEFTFNLSYLAILIGIQAPWEQRSIHQLGYNDDNLRGKRWGRPKISASQGILCLIGMCAQPLSCVQLFCDPMDCQVPLSMGFPRQEYWSGLPFPPPGDLLDPEIKSGSPASPALAGGL